MKLTLGLLVSGLFLASCGGNGSNRNEDWREPIREVTSAEKMRLRQHNLFLETYLKPVRLEQCTFKRFGENNDGGYLLCEESLNQVSAAYSYGISGYDGWGCQIAQDLDVITHQYDPFDTTRPVCTAKTQFHEEGIRESRFVDSQGRKFGSLADHIAANGDKNKTLILKMDVEGAEWASLLASPDETLAQFAQINIELHDLYTESNFDTIQKALKKLDELFHVAHVHANNCCCVSGNYLPASVIEVTYVNKKLFKAIPGAVKLPFELDSQNVHGKSDCPYKPL